MRSLIRPALPVAALFLAALSACGGIEAEPAASPPAAKTAPLAPLAHSVAERPIDGLAEAYREGAAERERLMALQMAEPASPEAP